MDMTQEIIEIIPYIMKIIFWAIGILLIRYVWPMVKPMMQYEIIQLLVNAAEKKAETGSIDKEAKKQFVIHIMELVKIPVNEFTMAMLESAVKELDLLEEKVLDYIKSDSKIEEPTECGEDVPRINSPESGTATDFPVTVITRSNNGLFFCTAS